MTETEPTVAEADDTVPDDLRAWGLSGQPVDWAFVTWQPVIATLRTINRGELPVSALQPLLDATFPDADYDAADIALAHQPTATFSAAEGETSTEQTFTLTGDADLNLPGDNVQWDFGDGLVAVASPSAEHDFLRPGTFHVTCSVAVAGMVTQTTQDVVVAGGAPPVLTSLDPEYVVNSGESLTLRVLGSGFDESTVIVFNGGDEATTFVSDSEVTTGVDPSTSSGQRTVPIQVRGAGGLSNTLGFDFKGLPAAEEEPPPPEPEVEGYDPGEHTVDEVLAYAAEHPDEVNAIAAAEEAGKSRVTLLDKL
jgi:hypothetical protein